MSDDIDRAQIVVERMQDEALRARKPEGPVSTGRCLNPRCDDLVGASVRWCCAGCRDQWQSARDKRA